MNQAIKMRKILCIIFVFFVFFIGNSFLYSRFLMDEDNVSDIETLKVELMTEQELLEESGADTDETFTLDDVMEYDSSEVDESEEKAEDDIEITSFDKDDWRIMLINKQHAVPEDYEFTLATIKGSMKCDERIIPELQQMMQAAKEDGVTLVIRSPYRDYERQIYLFNRKIKTYMRSQMSYLDAYRTTAQSVTIPGSSEHQVGLALDITSDTYTTLTEGFGETQAGKWLAEHSYEYGFILRYPDGKEDITGITFEPWHFRYIGKTAAKYIFEHDLTLEEFTAQLNE